jgi:hypothetical protein
VSFWPWLVSVAVSLAFRLVCLLSGTSSDSAAVPVVFENSAAFLASGFLLDVDVVPVVSSDPVVLGSVAGQHLLWLRQSSAPHTLNVSLVKGLTLGGVSLLA